MIEQGWDSLTRLVDGRWIERRPRRPSVGPLLLMETRLMPWLAPQLPLAVPVPVVVSHSPVVVRHAVVPGLPMSSPGPSQALRLGEFLRALHAADASAAPGLPAGPDLPLDAFTSRVLPLLPSSRQAAGRSLLSLVAGFPACAVVHGDLGPEHILATDGQVSGVIDFTDAHLGDPALDLAWVLYGTPYAFSQALATAYDVSPELRARALAWHRLGPWHEVLHGLTTSDPSMVESGMEGVLARLGP
ncbi:aminoglycoside phosphotransferase family protein [Nonomuraea sp. NPDC050536]|uniref:aminoglycoside phosphotransferase family protein n=1 Tax=Nonomuraea sp. NPDC050536 TaxID=3364366 RepID=UPI0037C50029